MGNFKASSSLKIMFPFFVSKCRRAINQVDAHIVYSRILRLFNTSIAWPAIMCTVHPLQVLFKKRLYANTKPVDAHCFQFTRSGILILSGLASKVISC